MSEQAKKSIFSKEISFSKAADEKVPVKHGINFIRNTRKQTDRRAAAFFAVFIVVLGVFTYFGVIRLLQRANAAEAEYTRMQQSIAQLNASMEDYDEVSKEYDQSIGTFLQGDESASIQRIEILDMLEQDIGQSIPMTDIRITGSQISVTTGETTLDVVSNVITTLQSDNRNTYAAVTTTSARNSTDDDHVYADFVITYGALPQASAAPEEGSDAQ